MTKISDCVSTTWHGDASDSPLWPATIRSGRLRNNRASDSRSKRFSMSRNTRIVEAAMFSEGDIDSVSVPGAGMHPMPAGAASQATRRDTVKMPHHFALPRTNTLQLPSQEPKTGIFGDGLRESIEMALRIQLTNTGKSHPIPR